MSPLKWTRCFLDWCLICYLAASSVDLSRNLECKQTIDTCKEALTLNTDLLQVKGYKQVVSYIVCAPTEARFATNLAVIQSDKDDLK